MNLKLTLERPLNDEEKIGDLDRFFFDQGIDIVGVDEVGRGCIAGPVVTACVRLDLLALLRESEKDRALIRDSKTLSKGQRIKAQTLIEKVAKEITLESIDASGIDSLGILNASLSAMRMSVEKLSRMPQLVLVDGNQKIPLLKTKQETIIKGDNKVYCIAAASIIAKNFRDKLMSDAAAIFPGYGFEKHVGYGTSTHLEALKSKGITPIHRMTFEPVKSMVAGFTSSTL